VGAGECSLLVSEQFGLEQRVLEDHAVYREESARPTTTQLVNHARDDFFTGPGGAEHQYGDIRLGDGAVPFEGAQHLVIVAGRLPEALDGWGTVLVADSVLLREKTLKPSTRLGVVRARRTIPCFGNWHSSSYAERD